MLWKRSLLPLLVAWQRPFYVRRLITWGVHQGNGFVLQEGDLLSAMRPAVLLRSARALRRGGFVVGVSGGLLGLSAIPAEGQAPPDYRDPAAWLCLPDRDDACAADQQTTSIGRTGSMAVENWAPNPSPSIDCFYVYPTVSLDPGGNSPLQEGIGEAEVVARQFARFGSRCRLFAPLYRQVTVEGERGEREGGGPPADRELAYSDLRAAWAHYIESESRGRGVVLIGHGQGAGHLLRLQQEEIEGTPEQERIVSAILPGWTLHVPESAEVGGDLASIPLCRNRFQFGCVISFASFRRDTPPPPEALFGRSRIPGMRVACTNPGALGGNNRGELKGFLLSFRVDQPPWVMPERFVTTPFVRLPGLIFGQCVREGRDAYLAVEPMDDGGPRTGALGGDVRDADGRVDPSWGLHLLDLELTIGNLLEIVEAQTQTYLASRLAPR